MALETQLVPISFAQGLDTKSDPKQVLVGKLTVLENGVFTRAGQISKRHGLDQLSNAIEGSTAVVSSGASLAASGDELLLFDGGEVFSYAASTGTWIDRGAAVSLQTKTTTVVRNSYAQSNPDAAVNANVRVVAWEDSRGGIRYSAMDVNSGAFFASDVQIHATAVKPKVIAFGTDIVIFYVSAGNLNYRRISITAPTALGAEVNPVSDLDPTSNHFDVVAAGAKLFVAYYQNATFTYLREVSSLYIFSAASSIGGASSACVGLFSDASLNVWVIVSDGAHVSVYLFTYTRSFIVSALIDTVSTIARVCGVVIAGQTAATVLYEVTTDATPSHNFVKSAAVSFAGAVSGVSVLVRGVGLVTKCFQFNARAYVGIAFQTALQSTYFTINAVTGAVVSKVNKNVAGGLRTRSALAESYSVPLPAADGARAALSVVNGPISGLCESAAVVAGQLIVVAGKIAAIPGVNLVRLDFTQTSRPIFARLNNNTLVVGGVVQSYDGLSLTEAGFHQYPENLPAPSQTAWSVVRTHIGDAGSAEISTITEVAGARIVGGQTFAFATPAQGYYVWFTVDGVGVDPAPGGGLVGIVVAVLSTDTQAQVCTKVKTTIDGSGAACTTTATATQNVITNTANGVVNATVNGAAPGGVATGFVAGTVQYAVIYEWTDNLGQVHRSAPSIGITVNAAGGPGSVTLTIPTLRMTRKSNVRIAVYRTLASGTTLYRVTPIATPFFNSTTTDVAYYVDRALDAAIATNEILYTTGGTLNYMAPEASSLVATYKGRAFLSGQANQNQVAFSQVSSPGDPVAFSDELTVAVDPRGGPITALGVMDAALVIFKASQVYVMGGEGPTNQGFQNDYGTPRLVTADVGCANPSSVVTTSEGLLFQSAKGIYLLNRSLAVEYVGAPVEAFNSQTIVSATLIPDTNQVRFLCSADPCLVYDYFFNQWSTFTNHVAVGGDVWQGRFTFARADGSVWKENPASFADGGNQFVRLRVQTGWMSFAGLQGFQRVRRLIALGDYKGPHQLMMQVATDFSPAFAQVAFVDATSLVGGSTYGSDPVYGLGVYGGTFTPYEFMLHVKQQKCTAMRVGLEDVQSSAYNEGMTLSAIALEVAVKPTGARIPAARRV